jgi:thymidylate synthase ThyX
MVKTNLKPFKRRVYSLDSRQLTEEQIAVTFAMTSRRSEPFDQIAEQVSEAKASDFHERWVLGYGHASVAEHSVVHMAVENISRLSCDNLEDNRLASYTEKSSRYQVMPLNYFHIPQELNRQPILKQLYEKACNELFETYFRLITGTMEYLAQTVPQKQDERSSTYDMRLRRIATDSCRAVLPASTLTNVGLTANARVFEHAISKLMSSGLCEEQVLGRELRDQGRSITPTLLKYADNNPYLFNLPNREKKLAEYLKLLGITINDHNSMYDHGNTKKHCKPSNLTNVRLIHCEQEPEAKLATALLFRLSQTGYEGIWRQVQTMNSEQLQTIIDLCVADLGPHDAPPREFEFIDYTFEFLMDYGAFREFKRHRMQSYLWQPLTINLGYMTPQLLKDAGLEKDFQKSIEKVNTACRQVYEFSPIVSQYLVTHAHYCRVISKIDLRECYHLFKLRTSSLAHISIQWPVAQAMKLAVEAHPNLFRHLRLRDYPDWWPF